MQLASNVNKGKGSVKTVLPYELTRILSSRNRH